MWGQTGRQQTNPLIINHRSKGAIIWSTLHIVHRSGVSCHPGFKIRVFYPTHVWQYEIRKGVKLVLYVHKINFHVHSSEVVSQHLP
jgi:hypothetical protein